MQLVLYAFDQGVINQKAQLHKENEIEKLNLLGYNQQVGKCLG
jgi:hypothetical protein